MTQLETQPAVHIVKEPEATPARTLEEINAEYNHLCAKAGDFQYKILCFQGELSATNQRLFAVNKEASDLKSQAITPEVV